MFCMHMASLGLMSKVTYFQIQGFSTAVSRLLDLLLCEGNKALHTWDIAEERDVLALSPWKLREDE